MRLAKGLAIGLLSYLALVIAFEALVGFMGRRQAERGLAPGESWLIVTTTRSDGSASDTVVAGVESDGALYVSSNHWLRAWYGRALESPEVRVTRGSETAPYRAVPISGDELARVSRDYPLPLFIRALSGFPPRRFLRLDPR
jgi:hypothetical protein